MSGKNEVELKGGMYTFMSLKLHTNDLDVIDARIAEKVQQAPGFFKDSPVVLDLSVIEEQLADGEAFDVENLVSRIRGHKLVPIVASVVDKSSPFATSIALPLMEAVSRREPSDSKTTSAETSSASSSGEKTGNAASLHSGNGRTAGSDNNASGDAADSELEFAPAKQVEVLIKAPMLLQRPVRSGQQVYARDTDLIIMGQVGAGAEVIADNNIHVYGPLRGRALCGVSGNTSTRIFCQSLEAELVSVAGNFRVLEEIPPDLRGKPAQIWLDKDRLNIEPLVDTNLSGVIA